MSWCSQFWILKTEDRVQYWIRACESRMLMLYPLLRVHGNEYFSLKTANQLFNFQHAESFHYIFGYYYFLTLLKDGGSRDLPKVFKRVYLPNWVMFLFLHINGVPSLDVIRTRIIFKKSSFMLRWKKTTIVLLHFWSILPNPHLTKFMGYGTRRYNSAFTRALQ